MSAITSNPNLVAYCGLYCGACGSYLKGRCKGCHDNAKATWCKVRLCCIERHYSSCADCKEFADPNNCKKYNNFISKLFGLLLRSDRSACIRQIKELGLEGHADTMAQQGKHSMKRT